jgi:hypothetical protein
VQREGGFAARLGPIDLDDAPPRITADAERHVEPEGARGDGDHVAPDLLALGEPHDGAPPELFLDTSNGEFQRLLLVLVVSHHWGSFGLWFRAGVLELGF